MTEPTIWVIRSKRVPDRIIDAAADYGIALRRLRALQTADEYKIEAYG